MVCLIFGEGRPSLAAVEPRHNNNNALSAQRMKAGPGLNPESGEEGC